MKLFLIVQIVASSFALLGNIAALNKKRSLLDRPIGADFTAALFSIGWIVWAGILLAGL